MPPRKRVRKRKRRNASSASSSSSSLDSSDGEGQVTKPIQPALARKTAASSDSSVSDTESSTSISQKVTKAHVASTQILKHSLSQDKHVPSRSSSPVDVSIPPMFTPSSATEPSEKEKALSEKFRRFWMSSVADSFKDDLEEIRKEPNLTTSRLSLLIDALASGADVYSSNDDPSINEMEMIMGDSKT